MRQGGFSSYVGCHKVDALDLPLYLMFEITLTWAWGFGLQSNVNILPDDSCIL